MVVDILLTLKSLHYSGDQKNFTFDQYCTAHVDQHNRHAALAKIASIAFRVRKGVCDGNR